MAKKQKRNQPPQRQRMKRPQRLESAKSWLETYEGNKVIRDYRRRYGVSWDVAFVELEMLNVPIDPDYKEIVLQTTTSQEAVKRQRRSRLRAQRADVWSQYGDNETALERAGECVNCDMFRPLDDMGLCVVCAAMLERDLIRQREWEYAASTAFLEQPIVGTEMTLSFLVDRRLFRQESMTAIFFIEGSHRHTIQTEPQHTITLGAKKSMPTSVHARST